MTDDRAAYARAYTAKPCVHRETCPLWPEWSAMAAGKWAIEDIEDKNLPPPACVRVRVRTTMVWAIRRGPLLPTVAFLRRLIGARSVVQRRSQPSAFDPVRWRATR